jgi:hypothetical protein
MYCRIQDLEKQAIEKPITKEILPNKRNNQEPGRQ